MEPSDFRAKFRFDPANRYCLGAEEEVWTVHPKRGFLMSVAPAIFTPGYEARLPGLKPELPAQQIEAVTPVCRTMAELKAALEKNDATLKRLARQHGFVVNREPVPTKPFPIEVFPTERYLRIKEKFGERLRGAYVAGLHVHVGLGTPEEAVKAMNFARVHLPAFLAISARSPRDVDGVHWRSYRYDRYREMAGAVAPPHLTDWAHFAEIAARCGFGDDPRMCWWALRVSPHGTVELRVCDLQADLARTLGIAALFRMMVRLGVEHRRPVEAVPASRIEENLLKAARGGFNVGSYLVRAVKLASHPLFREEKPYIQRLLG